MSLRDEENMVDLDKIAAVYLSFPYITAEVEIAGFYASSPYKLLLLEWKKYLWICTQEINLFEADTKITGHFNQFFA